MELTRLKTTVLAPMQRARVAVAATASTGSRRRPHVIEKAVDHSCPPFVAALLKLQPRIAKLPERGEPGYFGRHAHGQVRLDLFLHVEAQFLVEFGFHEMAPE